MPPRVTVPPVSLDFDADQIQSTTRARSVSDNEVYRLLDTPLFDQGQVGRCDRSRLGSGFQNNIGSLSVIPMQNLNPVQFESFTQKQT
jgi:hypothetical protein